MTLRVGILGGTFDPVHNAHLAMARAALRALPLDQLLWLPTGSPAYRTPPVAAAAHRVAMLRLALAGEPRYAIDDRELAPQASGYTYDSVTALRARHPGTEFVLLMGADQYESRGRWHRWAELATLCRIAVIERPGFPKPEGDIIPIPMIPLAVSASDIRARVARGEDLATLVPTAVADYIGRHGLYR